MGKKGYCNAYCSFCRKSYREAGPLVEGPGDVYICRECVELCQSIIEQEMRRRSSPTGIHPQLPGLTHIMAKLDDLVAGQAEAKEALAASVYNHYERFWLNKESKAVEGRSFVLLVGPAPSSRIFFTRALAHIFGVPFAKGNAATLMRSDFDARGPGSPILELLQAAEFDLKKAQYGIVYIEAVDQPEVQQPLLKMLDGLASSAQFQRIGLDSHGILFIFGGRFERVQEIIVSQGRNHETPLDPDRLIDFGISAGFATRLRAIVKLDPLDEETLVGVVSRVPWASLSMGSAATQES